MSNRVSDLNPDRFLVVGDTHGGFFGLKRAIDSANDHDIPVLIVVGDFGYWPRTPGNRKFLNKLTDALDETNTTLLFVDGNHEDHVALNSVPTKDDGVRVISPRVWHLPRGFRWEWGGLRMAALGGAYSVDRQWRNLGVSWFTEELVSDDEVDSFVAGGPADVVFMHDSPAGAPNSITDNPSSQAQGLMNFGSTALAEAALHREQLRRAIDPVAPAFIFHGHYHKYMKGEYAHSNGRRCRVYGLDESRASLFRFVTQVDVAELVETIAEMDKTE